ncbi:MAG: hypothetical protein HC915_14180, partial [Anaerolineae bacterium]|nr:hypothetical protein [Anaerolineae bacterium]
PAAELIGWYRRASLVTNLSPGGLFDKAALEAMLTGTPVVVASAAFDDLLGEHAPRLKISEPQAAEALAARLAAFLALPAPQRVAIGAALRRRTAAEHSLERLMQRLTALVRADLSKN